MRDLFWLSDAAWAKVEPHLPKNQPGKPRVDDRRVISGIPHILKTGGRWRDLPPAYGPAKTICNRWSRRGVWQRIFAKVAAEGPIPDELALDSTKARAHRSASGGKGGSGRRRWASQEAEGQRKSIVWPILAAGSSPSH
jgi:transposase